MYDCRVVRMIENLCSLHMYMYENKLMFICGVSAFTQYPYIPAHITKPKEQRKLFLVQLGEKGND